MQGFTPEKEAKAPRKWFYILLIATLSAILLLGAVLLITGRSKVPADLPLDVEVLPPDPEKTPLFSSATSPIALSGNGVAASVTGEVAILVDASSGEVLASKGANERYQPASITKVMTMIVACERLSKEDLDEKAAMTAEVYDYVRAGGYSGASNFPLDPGDQLTVKDLLFGVGVKSYADCTMLLVRKLAASEEEFVGWMNEKAAQLGMRDTHFDNAIGYESEGNYSTPRDLAVMMEYALRCDLIKEVLGTDCYKFTYCGYTKAGDWKEGIPGTFFSTLFNANGTGRIADYEKKIGKKFALATGSFGGGKTGSLKFDGKWAYSLISFATVQGKTYVSVVGNVPSSEGLMVDVKALYDTYAQ